MHPSEPRARNLIDTMEKLIALFDEEQALLRSRDMAALGALAERKHLLSKAYDEACSTMRLDLEGFRALPPEVKEALNGAAIRFRAAAQENTNQLRAATSVSQSVLNVIVNSINRHRSASSAYGNRRGGYGPSPQRRIPMPPMSVNRCL